MPRLKAIREAKGLSQRQLAEMTGISINSIISWEVGRRELINIYMLIRLAKALECDVLDLIDPEPTAAQEE